MTRLVAPVIAAAVVTTFAVACAHRAAPAAAAPPTAPTARELPPPDAIPGEFTVRQKLTARSARGGGSFEAVLQKKPGEVLLVGLTPFGSRAFVLRQTTSDVQFTSYVPHELPFPPTFMLLDVHRVLDAWLGPAPAPYSGERAGDALGAHIRERWRDGKLVERTFTLAPGAAAGAPPAEVRISYEGDGPAGLAAHVTLENLRFGYVLSIQSMPVR